MWSPFRSLSDAVSSAGSAIAQGWNDTVNAGSNIVQEATQSISEAVTTAVDTVVSAASDVVSNAQAAVDTAVEAVTQAADSVGEWLDAKVSDFQESPVDAIATMTPAYLVASLFNEDISTTPVSDFFDAASDLVAEPLDGIIAVKDWFTENWPWLLGAVVCVAVGVVVFKGRMLRRLIRG